MNKIEQQILQERVAQVEKKSKEVLEKIKWTEFEKDIQELIIQVEVIVYNVMRSNLTVIK